MRKKALILGTYHEAPYHPFQGVDELLAALLKEDFEASLTDQLPALTVNGERAYDLLISYLDAFDKPLPAGWGEAVLEFVRQGGGLLCLHNGISLQTDERVFHLIGGGFLNHPQQEELAFETTPSGILSDLPGFSMMEEPYQFALSGEAITPLLTYRYGSMTCLGGWSREEGGGRIVFLTPGHTVQTFLKKEYQQMIIRSAKWAGRLL